MFLFCLPPAPAKLKNRTRYTTPLKLLKTSYTHRSHLANWYARRGSANTSSEVCVVSESYKTGIE